MEEILALQRQLADAQISSTAAKLSERNCIELVMKLQSLSLVDLVFTRTGKEYLTPAQLTREVQDEIFVRGGRVNIIDLPDALNVDLSHIQAALPAVLDAASCETRVVNGEIVNDDYLASLAEEVDASLSESPNGIDDIGSIASRTNLPVAVIRDCIAKHLSTVIHATMDSSTGVLRSDASSVRAVAMARGALRATSTPALLSDMAERLDLPKEIVTDVVASLLAKNQLTGRVEGSGTRAVFLPAVFERAAQSAALSDFSSTGFMTTEKLRSLSIADPVLFVHEHAPGAVIFGDIIVGPSLLETVEGLAVEAIDNESWLDIEAALPPALPSEFIPHVVSLLDYKGKSPSKPVEDSGTGGGGKGKGKGSSKRKGVGKSSGVTGTRNDASSRKATKLNAPIYKSQFLVSACLLDRCRDYFLRDAAGRAKTRAEKLSALGAVVGGGSSAPARASDPGGPEKKSKGRRRKDKAAEVAGNGSSGVVKGSGTDPVPVQIPDPDELCDMLTAAEDFRDMFTSDYLGNATVEEGDVLRAVVEDGLIGPDGNGISSIYEEAAASAVVQMEKEREAAKQLIEKEILTGLERAELFDNMAGTLKSVLPDAPEASSEYALESTCRSATLHVMNFVANGVGVPGSGSDPPGDIAELIRDFSKRLPSNLATLTRPLVSSVTGKNTSNVKEFLQAYDESAEALDLPVRRPLDKKRERAVNSTMMAELNASLDEPSLNSIDALRTCTVLLHARRSGGSIVCLPPAQVPKVAAAMEAAADRPVGSGTALRDLRETVTTRLRESGEGPIESDVRALVQIVRDLVVL